MRASTLVYPIAAAISLAGCSDTSSSPSGPATPSPATVSFAQSDIQASIGDTVRLRLVHDGGSRPTSASVRWRALDPSVVLIEDGLIIPVGEGSTQVVAYVGGSQATASIQARSSGVTPASLRIAALPADLSVGDSAQVNAELAYSNGLAVKLRASIRWTSANPLVASVVDGTVVAKAPGTTKLVAAQDALSDTVEVVVAAVEPPSAPEPEPTPAPGEHLLPELPRVYLETPMPSVTGKTISVPAGSSLQAAIDAAEPGDQIVLQAGATYTGTFTLRKKAGSGPDRWITIRTSGSLPGEGVRVTPAHAAQMPRLVASTSTQPVLRTEAGASHYRLVGLEVTVVDGATKAYSLVTLGESGSAQNTEEKQPHHLVLDRMYVHGTPTLDFQRCIALNSASTAIIDSWISECHGKGYDSQAIWGSNGAGPYKIVNNHLAGAGENIMFGGADPKIPGMLPRDIEIRRNHFYKDPAWIRADGYKIWTVKNLFELKMGQRVLVEGNIFENNWGDAQVGFAIVLKSTNQSGSAPWSETSDVTFRYNLIRNSAHGVNVAAAPESKPAVPASRMLFEHNVFDRIGNGDYKGGRLWQVSGVSDLTIARNTHVGGTHGIILTGNPADRLAIVGNVFGPTRYPVSGSGRGYGTRGLEARATDWRFEQNVLQGARSADYPPGNSYPRSFGFSSVANLLTDAAQEGGTTEAVPKPAPGGSPGADIGAVRTAIRGVIVGTRD